MDGCDLVELEDVLNRQGGVRMYKEEDGAGWKTGEE